MKVLLTGSRGFTGYHFTKFAHEAGHTVIPLGVNILDKDKVFTEIKEVKPDCIVHLAAISSVDHSNYSDFYNVNVIGTTNILDATTSLSSYQPKVLITSSANIYGNNEESPLSEESPVKPVNHYAVSKLAMEYLVKTYFDKLPIIIARPFNYTGPRQSTNFLIPKLVDSFARKLEEIELGNLHIEREFNDVRMVCEAYLRLLSNGSPSEIYNICSGNTYSLGDVISLLEKITGHKVNTKVNKRFVRNNEVHKLYGNPSKLWKATGVLYGNLLEETLRWMLNESQPF